MTLRHIDKVGVEIEGGWSPEVVIPTGTGNKESDGSVNGFDTICDAGEVVSKPFTDVTKLTSWMTTVWPQHVNQTCGLHVHVSLKTRLDYCRLMDERFFSFFLQRMEAWGQKLNIQNKHFFARLKGENHFCRKVWNPDLQVDKTGKDSIRYAHWNFAWSVRNRKTAECRLLPTFKNPKIGCSAVTHVIGAVEDYLDRAPVFLALETKLETEDVDLPPALAELMR